MSAKFPRGGGGSKPILSHPSMNEFTEEEKRQNKPLLWQEPVPSDNQITFCVNYNDQGDAFYQSTHTVGTKHGYHFDASQKTHYAGTMSEQRRIYVDVTSFCNITVDTTPLRRCVLIYGSHQRRMPRFKSASKAPSFLFTFPKISRSPK